MVQTPDEILAELDSFVRGADVNSVRRIMHEIIADVSHSWEIAVMTLVGDRLANDAAAEVDDYVASHYGDG